MNRAARNLPARHRACAPLPPFPWGLTQSSAWQQAMQFNRTTRAVPWITRLIITWLMLPSIGRHSVLMRSEENTSELQSLMRISYDDFVMKKKTLQYINQDISTFSNTNIKN